MADKAIDENPNNSNSDSSTDKMESVQLNQLNPEQINNNFPPEKTGKQENPKNELINEQLRMYMNLLIKQVEATTSKQNINDVTLKKPKKEHPTVPEFDKEELIKKVLEDYESILTDDCHNIDIWIKLINFQDIVFCLIKPSQPRSESAEFRALTNKKLGLLHEALSTNPNCEKLIRLQVSVMQAYFEPEKLQERLGVLMGSRRGKVIYWQGIIEANQSSFQKCKVKYIFVLYKNCLTDLLTVWLHNKSGDKTADEEAMLRMMYQCGLFLRQAGFFDQMWYFIKVALQENFPAKYKNLFNISVDINKKILKRMKSDCINSNFNEAWTKIEIKYDLCHWLPDKSIDNPEFKPAYLRGVQKYLKPFDLHRSTFKLTVTALTLLKLPLLPCKHTTMKTFGMDSVPWALESVENLIPIYLSAHSLNTDNDIVFKCTKGIFARPQYLKDLPGKETYLMLIVNTMMSCIECLKGEEKLAVQVWWIRFFRLLNILRRSGNFDITDVLWRKLAINVRNLIKENTGNLILLQEYALYDFDSGFIRKAFDKLKEYLKDNKNKSVMSIYKERDVNGLCSVFRTLIELLVNKGINKSLILEYFLIFITRDNFDEETPYIKPNFEEINTKFSEVTTLLLQNYENQNRVEGFHHFLPDYFINWILLNAWFLYLYSYDNCYAFINKVIKVLDSHDLSKGWHQENLTEFLIAINYRESKIRSDSDFFKKFDVLLEISIERFPNNLFILSIFAKLQNDRVEKKCWLYIKHVLLTPGHALPSFFLILIRTKSDFPPDEDPSAGPVALADYHHDMLKLFQQLTNEKLCTRKCVLVWEAYFIYAYNYFGLTKALDVYFGGITYVPWLKSLHTSLADFHPNRLPSIINVMKDIGINVNVTIEKLMKLQNKYFN